MSYPEPSNPSPSDSPHPSISIRLQLLRTFPCPRRLEPRVVFPLSSSSPSPSSAPFYPYILPHSFIPPPAPLSAPSPRLPPTASRSHGAAGIRPGPAWQPGSRCRTEWAAYFTEYHCHDGEVLSDSNCPTAAGPGSDRRGRRSDSASPVTSDHRGRAPGRTAAGHWARPGGDQESESQANDGLTAVTVSLRQPTPVEVTVVPNLKSGAGT
eukprot:762877-Hanusia_phi.AAC.1